jgi:hypothetical protein
MEGVVRRGGTFYLTPEGKYSIDGRMRPMRGAVERLAPLATIYLVGVSYDPFVARRLSLLYRVARFDGDGMELLAKALAAIRPVTASQLIGTWLAARDGNFTLDDAVAAVETLLVELPPAVFVDPELRRHPHALVASALPLMLDWKILERDGDRYRLSLRRRHPQFPFVDDIVAYQARFLEETLESVEYASHAHE